MTRPRLSLKARALAWLAQREHSRVELRRKLLRVARAEASAADELARAADAAAATTEAEAQAGAGADAPADTAGPAPCGNPERCVDALLDWLQEHRYLSDTRFVESRVNVRAARYGNLRIRQELAQHGVEPDPDTLAQLRDSEFARAQEVWRRKFGQLPADARERGRQTRFLAQRGFSGEVVRRVLLGHHEDD